MRITKETKAIADAHISARINGKFDDLPVTSREEAIAQLRAGKTFYEVLRQIEVRYCSTGSILTARLIQHSSAAYKQGVYNGFKTLLQTQNK